MVNHGPSDIAPRVLLLGGTAEASALASTLAQRGTDAIFSYAGRVRDPKPQPIRTRVGGFGGADGLAQFLRDQSVTHVVDATHPFASQMSIHAVEACARTSIPLLALQRPPWTEQPGDRWTRVPNLSSVGPALGPRPLRVFLAIGRRHVSGFEAYPAHFYLLRFVDQPPQPPRLPHHTLIIDRGPFEEQAELERLRHHRIDVVVSKNAGGDGAYGKMAAARRLGLPVIVVDRPRVPLRTAVRSVPEVVRWLDHGATDLGE